VTHAHGARHPGGGRLRRALRQRQPPGARSQARAGAAPGLQRTDHILDGCVSPGVPLGLQPFVDAFGRVPLLFRHGLVGFQDLDDPAPIRTDLGLQPGCLETVTGRGTMRQDLLQRRPVHARLAQNLSLRYPFDQYSPADIAPLLHVSIHSFSLPGKLIPIDQLLGVLIGVPQF